MAKGTEMEPNERPGDMDLLTWLLRVRPKIRESEFNERWNLLVQRPDLANMTWDELHADICRLKAKSEDMKARLAQTYRDHGFMSHYDLKLFQRMVGRYYIDHAAIHRAMEALRRKKRRGHKQQEALDIWDAHYASRDWDYADNEDHDRLQALWTEQEEAREPGRTVPE
jgi:hypothetical protein